MMFAVIIFRCMACFIRQLSSHAFQLQVDTCVDSFFHHHAFSLVTVLYNLYNQSHWSRCFIFVAVLPLNAFAVVDLNYGHLIDTTIHKNYTRLRIGADELKKLKGMLIEHKHPD